MSGDTSLGIDPGTRLVGIAVVQDGVILHSQIRSFQGKWSSAKLKALLTLIQATAKRYDVNRIAVKLPDVLPTSRGFTQLIGSINVLCERNRIKPRHYSLSEITARHCVKFPQTRSGLMETIVNAHPELSLEYRREQRNSNAYYYKVFEAVAVAKMR